MTTVSETTTAETVDALIDLIPPGTRDRLKTRWDKLQGREHDLSRDRASLLYEVWDRLQKNDALLEAFLVNVLDEYAGKRCRSFVRLVHAFDVIRDPVVWTQVGGIGVTFLSRIKPTKVRATMTKVRSTIKSTGRNTLSNATFRTILRNVLGADAYDAILLERQTGRRPNMRAELSTMRGELVCLKAFVLSLLHDQPNLRRKLPKDVRHALGLDLVS